MNPFFDFFFGLFPPPSVDSQPQRASTQPPGTEVVDKISKSGETLTRIYTRTQPQDRWDALGFDVPAQIHECLRKFNWPVPQGDWHSIGVTRRTEPDGSYTLAIQVRPAAPALKPPAE